MSSRGIQFVLMKFFFPWCCCKWTPLRKGTLAILDTKLKGGMISAVLSANYPLFFAWNILFSFFLSLTWFPTKKKRPIFSLR